MINVVCGFSGAGKTTYVLNHKKKEDVLIDLDYLKESLSKFDNSSIIKDLQIKIAEFFLSRDVDIWYVTCFPNFEELELFENRATFIWINTSLSKSLENICKRNRNGDLSNIKNIKHYNENVAKRYYSSNIHFKAIDVFESDERW